MQKNKLEKLGYKSQEDYWLEEINKYIDDDDIKVTKEELQESYTSTTKDLTKAIHYTHVNDYIIIEFPNEDLFHVCRVEDFDKDSSWTYYLLESFSNFSDALRCIDVYGNFELD